MLNSYHLGFAVEYYSGYHSVHNRFMYFLTDDEAIEYCRKLELKYGNQLKNLTLEKVEPVGLPIYRKIFYRGDIL